MLLFFFFWWLYTFTLKSLITVNVSPSINLYRLPFPP